MMRRHLLPSVLLALAPLACALFVSLSGCASGPALRAGDPVPYPEGFRGWQHVKSMLIEEGHPLYTMVGGLHHVYANPAAAAGLRTGQYADGAVLVFDLFEAKADGAAKVEGPRKFVGVMHRHAGAFASTGGWGFAGFSGDSRDNMVKDAKSGCFDCHAGQKEQSYVFTQMRG